MGAPRIGVIAPEFPPQIGGVETYALQFTRALAGLGFDVTVFTRPHDGGEIQLPGVEIIPELRLRRRIDRHLFRRHSMDAWHAMSASYAWLAMETRPVVVSVHGNDFLRPYNYIEKLDIHRLFRFGRPPAWVKNLDIRIGKWLTLRLIARALPRCQRILANSRFTEQVLLRKIPACRGLTTPALVGVAQSYLDTQPPRKSGTGPAELVTIARLSEPRKHVDQVLRALANLRDRFDFRYTVVGDGYLLDELKSLAANLQLDQRVRFAGRVGDDEITRLLCDADLFILTSAVSPVSHEGFGIVYLEANACGTPVLAARLAGAVEAVDEGITGMFVDEPDEQQITRALEEYLNGRDCFDLNACRAFARDFTWRKVVEHALPYYGIAAKPAGITQAA